jgi:outer membrane protein assembly factor BamB
MMIGETKRFGPALLRALLAVSLAGMLGACSVVDYVKSIGDDDDEDAALAPAELVDFTPEVDVRKVWSTGVGNGQGKLYNRLQPALYGDAIYVAAENGTVAAIDAVTGDRRWKADVDTDLSGGVGAGGDLVLVGNTRGRVIAMESATGRELWRASVSSEVLAPPAADWDVVVVQTLDGKVTGLDAATGARRWTHDSSNPLLTLRGTAAPVLSEGVAYAALASGRIVAIKADTGTVLWEGRVATPQGQSEIERTVDIEGRPLLIGSNVFAVSYQGKLGGLGIANGRPVWARDASSYVGIAEGFGNIYVAEASGTVSAYEVAGGALRWQNDQLARRQPGTPAVIGSYVAVADFDGYVHLLSQADGHFAGRVRADGDGVRADMITGNDMLYVYGNDGGLRAYRVESR